MKLLGHARHHDGADPHLRNLVVEVRSGSKVMRSQAFSVQQGRDAIQVNEVLFVPQPPREGAASRRHFQDFERDI